MAMPSLSVGLILLAVGFGLGWYCRSRADRKWGMADEIKQWRKVAGFARKNQK